VEVEDKSELVSIGTHSLHLTTIGPPRKLNQPVIIFFLGIGDTISEWVAARRLVSSFAIIYLYGRSSLGLSGESPIHPTAENIALEASLLLDVINVKGPFVLVAHSMGGLNSREFLELRKEEVVGMVLIDAVTENQHLATRV
jgi:pimeloyl-ACP methyl ester carboxylesterase